jgi:hypothetical protein
MEQNELRYKSNPYMQDFLSLKCTGDIINACFPIGNKAEKEITESMAVIKKLRHILLKDHLQEAYLYDLCAGNALTSVIASHLFKLKLAVAVDKRERIRRFELVKNFEYLQADIYNIEISNIKPDSIIIGVHACGELANRIIDIYNQSKARYLILMPCCQGTITKTIPYAIREIIKNDYVVWAWQLTERCNGKLYFDNHCLSPKNAIITATKKGELS